MMPKSSVVSTIPVPNSSYHMRLTVTRAVSGLSGLTVHLASASRSCGPPAGSGGRKCGVFASTRSVPRRIHPARQHMRIGDRRLLPRNQRQVAALGELVQLRIQLVDLFLDLLCLLVNVIEVELAGRVPLIFVPLAGRLGRQSPQHSPRREAASLRRRSARAHTAGCPGSASPAPALRLASAIPVAWAPGSGWSPAAANRKRSVVLTG